MLAGSIPVFWGDPSVFELVNPKSFIYVENFKDALDKIKMLDKNYYMYEQMYNESWLQPGVLERFSSEVLNEFGREIVYKLKQR